MTRVLLIHPRFNNSSFWNYESSSRLIGARYPAPPLGLMTIAAMLPTTWELKLVDRNVTTLDETLFDWADLVMMGGMMPQQLDMLAVIKMANEHKVPIAMGGPGVMSEPAVYNDADYLIIGEAEGAIDNFLEAWKNGEPGGVFKAPLHSVDVTQTPVPRFDLINFSDYVMANVQFSRGCPFLCEFCDIIELFGRKPRTKNIDQVLSELEAVYQQGHRGHVDFVDDNLIGNKKAVKQFLPHLIEWQRERNYPFVFSTEASLNLADDEEFLGLMRDAGFFGVFVGIESPDPDVLAATQKKQNIKRDIATNIHKIQSYGIFVVGGFIVGFDNEGKHVDRGLIELIEEASIPISMVGMLFALPNTQLTRRLQAEGRLHDRTEFDPERADQCTAGLNFTPLRPRVEIIREYKNVVDNIFERKRYFARVRQTIRLLDMSNTNVATSRAAFFADTKKLLTLLWNSTFRSEEIRFEIWKLLAFVLVTNPKALKSALNMAIIYDHLGPFSRFVSGNLQEQITEILENPNFEEEFLLIPPDQKFGKESDLSERNPVKEKIDKPQLTIAE